MDDSFILSNLKERFQNKKIYVSYFVAYLLWFFVIQLKRFQESKKLHHNLNFLPCSQTYASNVLIALNPNVDVPQLYGPGQISRYLENDNLFDEPPHIYAIGNYSSLVWQYYLWYMFCSIHWCFSKRST